MMREARKAMNNAAKIKQFGSHLRRLREAAGMSQQELADTAYMAKTTIQRIENAKYATTLDTLITLAKALEISLGEFMDF